MNEERINFSDTVLSAPALPPDLQRFSPKKKGGIQDMCFAAALFILSFLSIRVTAVYGIGWLHTVILIACMLLSVSYVHWHGYEIDISNRILFVCLLLACLPNMIFTNYDLKVLNVLFVNILQMYWILKCCGHLSERKTGNWVLLDMLISAVLLPYEYLYKSYCFLAEFTLRKVQIKTVIRILVGCLISLPLLIIILPQLLLADETFSRLFRSFFMNIDHIVIYGVQILMAVPLFFYYYSAVYGNVFHMVDSADKKRKAKEIFCRFSRIPSVVLITVEAILCLIYMLFIAVSVYSIYHAVTAGNTDLVYSAYAREGFFELCRISFINFLVLIWIEISIEKENLHIHTVAKGMLCLETVCIIMTALFKMGLYIYRYGFTYKRIYAAWLMLVLLGIFLLVWYHTMKKGHVILHITRYACICFVILNMLNIDELVSPYTRKRAFLQHDRIDVLECVNIPQKGVV